MTTNQKIKFILDVIISTENSKLSRSLFTVFYKLQYIEKGKNEFIATNDEESVNALYDLLCCFNERICEDDF